MHRNKSLFDLKNSTLFNYPKGYINATNGNLIFGILFGK